MNSKKILSSLLFLCASPVCFASGASRHFEQILADYLVWVVILLVPVVVIYLFWKIHILPELYAEKIYHPQTKLIKVLCLLSIVFGGLLWPLAWILAYSKPTFYKMAYGTDKSDEYFLKPDGHHADKPLNVSILDDEISNLKEKLEGLEEKKRKILDPQKVT